MSLSYIIFGQQLHQWRRQSIVLWLRAIHTLGHAIAAYGAYLKQKCKKNLCEDDTSAIRLLFFLYSFTNFLRYKPWKSVESF